MIKPSDSVIKKVLVAMSGGVDSSMTAALLQDQGYEIIGATFKLFTNDATGDSEQSRTCCSLDDVTDARRVARSLGFEHYVFNFSEQFRCKVIQRFADTYARGETPNPCIDCNRYIKFARLLERADMLDIDYIATGHYARVEFNESSRRYLLKKSADPTKDQTYVLYALTQRELSRLIFPLGSMVKSTVRSGAAARGLANAHKPDSQDICFVPNGHYAEFLKNVLSVTPTPGDFVDRNGTIIGTHRGLIHYTIGQRKGLNLNIGQPKYVISKDRDANTITLGDESELYTDEIYVSEVNLIAVEHLSGPVRADVKIRYSQAAVPATLYPVAGGRIQIKFEQPQRAITPGQAAVFYQGDIVLGGGTIMQSPVSR